MPPTPGRPPPTKKKETTPIQSLDDDIMCTIFCFLGLFDLVRSSAVCKSWNQIIRKLKLLEALYTKQQGRRWGCREESLGVYLEELAMKYHRDSLVRGFVVVDQWKGHALGVDQCRMKMGLVLTGVGDKVMRLWSLESYTCLEEHSVPAAYSLVDFDFDESKILRSSFRLFACVIFIDGCTPCIVGLLGTQLCIWRRNGQRSIFPSCGGTFTKGLCMRYFDPEAVIGCKDGTVRVFDMYGRRCSRIIRMHAEPATCLSLADDQTIVSGSSLGRIAVCCQSSDQRVALLRPSDSTGVKTLCLNPNSYQIFAGTTSGYTSCWDLRMMKRIWETRVSSNVVYSIQHQGNDTSTLVVGGIDGVLRVVSQNTGEVLSSYVMEHDTSSCSTPVNGAVERRMAKKLRKGTVLDQIPRSSRPPITCLAVGMTKVVTTHNSKYIRLWRFNN